MDLRPLLEKKLAFQHEHGLEHDRSGRSPRETHCAEEQSAIPKT
ncbi:MAG: hypothetical protein ACRCY0_02215 [Synechococcus elongatus]|nr:hypothetical protein [Synechococcus elongatus]